MKPQFEPLKVKQLCLYIYIFCQSAEIPLSSEPITSNCNNLCNCCKFIFAAKLIFTNADAQVFGFSRLQLADRGQKGVELVLGQGHRPWLDLRRWASGAAGAGAMVFFVLMIVCPLRLVLFTIFPNEVCGWLGLLDWFLDKLFFRPPNCVAQLLWFVAKLFEYTCVWVR